MTIFTSSFDTQNLSQDIDLHVGISELFQLIEVYLNNCVRHISVHLQNGTNVVSFFGGDNDYIVILKEIDFVYSLHIRVGAAFVTFFADVNMNSPVQPEPTPDNRPDKATAEILAHLENRIWWANHEIDLINGWLADVTNTFPNYDDTQEKKSIKRLALLIETTELEIKSYSQ